MFDSIIAQTNERFNVNGKAETLLSALLALMTEETRGGLTGFTEKFRQIGLNDTVSSWIDSGENAEISNSQLESALDRDTLNDIANQSGIDYDTTVSASAFMIPRVVDVMTPDGVLPQDKDFLSKIGGFITGSATIGVTAEETFDRIGTAAAPVLDSDKRSDDSVTALNEGAYPVVDKVNADIDRAETNLDRTAAAAADSADRNDSPFAWILPLLLLGLLLVLGYWFCSKSPSPVTEAVANRTVTNTANQ